MPARIIRPSKAASGLRFFGSLVDPRAWLHGLKLLNYYCYSHVRPLRHIARGPDCRISPTANYCFYDGHPIAAQAVTKAA